jgi:DNA repair ATPase RecN
MSQRDNTWREENPRVIRPSAPVPDPEFHYARELLLRAKVSREDIAEMARGEVIDAARLVEDSLDIPKECKTPTIEELKRMTSSELAAVKEKKERLGTDLYYEVQSLAKWEFKMTELKIAARKWATPETMTLFEKMYKELDDMHTKKWQAKENVKGILGVIDFLEEEILNGSKRQKVGR